jgi:hypothetical protein
MASTSNQGFAGGQQPSRANEGTLAGMASAVKDRVEDVASTAQEAWDSTRQGVQHAASAVADTAGGAWGELTGLMRRYPFATFFAGVGAGILLTRLLEERGTRDFRRVANDLYDRVRDYASDVASKVRS